MLIGSHLSIAGGVENALVHAHEYGFEALAMFVRNQRQWVAPALADESVELFRHLRREYGIGPIIAHASYLVNLAGEEEVRRKSVIAVADELDRSGRLGIDGLVLHPGSCPNTDEGMARIAESLNAVLSACKQPRVRVLLETTAGAGHHIGGRFEELAELLARLSPPERFGICLDTCHIFAAGYDIRTRQAYAATMEQFDRIIGLKNLFAVHANDSVKGLGSHLDRHAHIGAGAIGVEGFAQFVNDPRLASIPLILETPKDEPPGTDWDAVNANLLRSLRKAEPAGR